ncbi:MAG: diaminopimelate epimerase [Candidatus Kapaibacteriota bacterium]|jgi:diaminopimelate epimerase
MEIELTIMSGAGNIFSVVDNRNYSLSKEFFIKNAPKICSKSYSKGNTEGLLVVETASSNEKDFALKYFNPDGSYGMMCGNGGRCAVLFAKDKGIIETSKSRIRFDVWEVEYIAELIEDKIRLKFPPPTIIKKEILVTIEKDNIFGDYINVNSPHFVINFIDSPFSKEYDFFEFPLHEIAPKIRGHEIFRPDGVNVNFYLNFSEKIYLRTYERGVEKETGACGTGAISTAVSLFLKNHSKKRFLIVPPSKEELEVEIYSEDSGNITEIYLTGKAKVLEIAKLDIDDRCTAY